MGRSRARVKKLASAALNADVTIDQATAVLNDLAGTIEGMDTSMADFDVTVARVNASLDEFDRLVGAIAVTLGKADNALERLNAILAAPLALADAAESVLISPVTGAVGRWLRQARR